jgi:hypothetical protein
LRAQCDLIAAGIAAKLDDADEGVIGVPDAAVFPVGPCSSRVCVTRVAAEAAAGQRRSTRRKVPRTFGDSFEAEMLFDDSPCTCVSQFEGMDAIVSLCIGMRVQCTCLKL